jgi:hypothetical protein
MTIKEKSIGLNSILTNNNTWHWRANNTGWFWTFDAAQSKSQSCTLNSSHENPRTRNNKFTIEGFFCNCYVSLYNINWEKWTYTRSRVSITWIIFDSCTLWSDCRSRVFSTPALYLEGPRFTSGSETTWPDRVSSWFSSFPPGRCRNSLH